MNVINSKDLKQNYLTVLIYATPGMGKTTLLGMLRPKTLIIDVDNGTSVLAKDFDADIVKLSDDLHEFPEIIKELQTKCTYKNVAVDSLSELERSMLAYYGKVGSNNGVPGIDAYNRVDYKILNYCRMLRTLKANIIFTAWEKQRNITAVTGEIYTQAYPLLREKIADNICGLCDIVGRITNDGKERIINLESTMSAIAKDRIFKRKSCKFEEVIQ